MGRSVPAYLLLFLIFSFPLASIQLIAVLLLIPWMDLLLDKAVNYLHEHSSWDEVTVLADGMVVLQSLKFMGHPGSILDVREANRFTKVQLICQLWELGRVPVGFSREWTMLLMAAELWNLITRG